MKFLNVIGSMDPRGGGPAQGIRGLASEMGRSGHRVEVVCLDDPNSNFLSQDPLDIHALGQGRGNWNYHPQLLPWLNKNLGRFDAVILNGLWQYQQYALYKAASRPNMPPYFIFAHGMLDPWFQRAPERRLKALRNWLYWKLIENRIVRHASAMLFTCEEELRLARQTFRPYRPKREINVGFGVHNPPLHHPDMEKAFVESCPGVLGKPYLLFLGRIHPKKGVDLLIKAYSSLSRLHERDLLPKIVIAGPSLETPYGQSMKKLAAEICPPDSFFWPGMLVSNQKWGALYNCEASILPSHQENFGVAVVETLACDRPVLISNQVNIWRELKEAGAALVQDDSVEGTAQMLTDWIKLSSEAKLKMTVQAKNCFESNFSIESATRRLLAALTPEAKT